MHWGPSRAMFDLRQAGKFAAGGGKSSDGGSFPTSFVKRVFILPTWDLPEGLLVIHSVLL